MPTVGLLGATGYTGTLVAAELKRRGITAVLAGRSQERLATLQTGLRARPGSGRSTNAHVEVTDAAAVSAFCQRVDVVINCVGPFARFGLPVVGAATSSRTPYVDSTGETSFMQAVYRRYRRAPSPVVPACGFDYLPGDCAVALALAGLPGPVTEVVVAYSLAGGRVSRGTARTALGAAGALAGSGLTRLRVEFPDGARSAIEIPWGEELTTRLTAGAELTVRTGFLAPDPVARAAALAAPLVAVTAPLTRLGLRLAGPVLERAVDLLPEGPTQAQREGSRFEILAEARGATRSRVLVSGQNPYGLTARFLVEAAVRAVGAPKGALAPSQLGPPAELLDAVAGRDLSWRRL